jgi:hypothetical protein
LNWRWRREKAGGEAAVSHCRIWSTRSNKRPLCTGPSLLLGCCFEHFWTHREMLLYIWGFWLSPQDLDFFPFMSARVHQSRWSKLRKREVWDMGIDPVLK